MLFDPQKECDIAPGLWRTRLSVLVRPFINAGSQATIYVH